MHLFCSVSRFSWFTLEMNGRLRLSVCMCEHTITQWFSNLSGVSLGNNILSIIKNLSLEGKQLDVIRELDRLLLSTPVYIDSFLGHFPQLFGFLLLNHYNSLKCYW